METNKKSGSESQAPAQALENLPFPTAMHAGYGFLLRWLFRRFFARIKFPAAETERIRDLAKKGVVVYVMASRSFLSYLFFNWAYMVHNLPLARFVNGIWYELYQPLSWWLRYRKIKIPGVTGRPFELETRLNWVTRLGGSSLIFLRKPRSLATPDNRFDVDYILSLVRLQRNLERPVYLYPQLLLYHSRPASAEPTLVDAMFGNRTQPTLLREVISFIFHRGTAEARFGEPLDLLAFLKTQPGVPDEIVARKVRFLLNRTLHRERVAVTGPDQRVPQQMRELVLRDPLVREAMYAETAGGSRPEVVDKRAQGIVKRLVAQLNYAYIDLMEYFVLVVWRITGIKLVYDKSELKPIREAARRGPLVLCPMHRSHVDYLIVSQIFHENGLIVPHIAAGENLSFWPLGHIFRHMGAFFLRRSFKGDQIYSAIFRAYIKRLLREGWTQEFFIEGTRSRTGKMLPPKMGLLSFIVDAYLGRASDDVMFVPISIMYEKVVEGESYMKELLGGAKTKEDFAGLIKTTGVLTSRYGNIYVRFGEPVSLDSFLKLRGLDRDGLGSETLRKAVDALGYHITHKIGEIAIVAPTPVVATVMLTAPGPLDEQQISARVASLLEIIRSQPGVKLSPVFYDTPGAVRECINKFVKDKRVLRDKAGAGFTANPRARLQLDYYKNSMLHFVLPTAIASNTIRSMEGHSGPQEELFRRARRLRDILRYEFNYEVNVTFDELFDRELNSVFTRGFVDVEEGAVRLKKEAEPLAEMLGRSLENFLESYFIAAEALALLRRGPMDRKEFVKKTQLLGKAMLDSGKLACIESLSSQNIENALSLFIRENLIVETESESADGKRRRKQIELVKDGELDQRLREFRTDLLAYMGRSQ